MKAAKITAFAALWTFWIVILLGQIFIHRANAEERVWVDMPICQFEDGNPDGKTCLWIDPDTGKGYVSLSENYWGLQEEI